ncbi:MAG: DUF92 domain-containing protein [Acidobacteriota bacterium]|nr:DUF92 domain-containing protein [Acidobacteriota bacterium]
MIIGFVPAALTLILRHGLPVGNIARSAVISGLFALFAWLLGGVSASGALAGFAIAFTLYMSGGWPVFALLLFVFVLTWAVTRSGYARKLARGLTEPGTGRSAAQVVANVGLAAWVLMLDPAWWTPLRVAASCAALAVLAEAAADTCASEIGKAYGQRTVLLTTGRPVPPGTDGGVSWVGMACALSASLLVAAAAFALGVVRAHEAALVTLAAGFGAVLDSLLGATLEQRGWINNDAVNLLGTLTAAGLAAGLCLVLLHQS